MEMDAMYEASSGSEESEGFDRFRRNSRVDRKRHPASSYVASIKWFNFRRAMANLEDDPRKLHEPLHELGIQRNPKMPVRWNLIFFELVLISGDRGRKADASSMSEKITTGGWSKTIPSSSELRRDLRVTAQAGDAITNPEKSGGW
ncbi:hypothetical protein NP233_g4224 [Leucocoprinus birnbaumii]|uniref:Uncharacterized protein n=1 Tax=Leucocoprinus birnbaumii TaxID=56174 RepID=A0AAD5VV30_9AGAR|nr:hypothetical protein NP233_g4224 [Leucocoprinus birnbaumii]